MKISKVASFLGLTGIILFLTACSLPFSASKKKAALQISSNPQATVFLDGQHLGQTSYFDEKLKPGEYTLKLIPSDDENSSWQRTIRLTPGVLSVVSHNFGKTEEESSGYILNLEPVVQKDQAKISIVSIPDGAILTIDGEPKGFTPLSLEDVSEGDHLLSITTPGFEEKEIKAKTVKGYKLIINVQLARAVEEDLLEESEEATLSSGLEEDEPKGARVDEATESTGSAKQMAKPYVKIKDTPTGWLNVRSEPSTTGKEETIIETISPGEIYKFIEMTDNGWYKIEYAKGKEGWVAAQYVELFR